MNELISFLKKLFDDSDWTSILQSGHWSDFEIGFYIFSNVLLLTSYLTLPVIILVYVTKKNYSRFHNLYLLSALFIFFTALTITIDIISLWRPVYRLDTLLCFITGVITWITIISVIRVIPVVVKFRSARELTLEVEKYKSTEELIRIQNNKLNEAQEISMMGHWEWNVSNNKLTWSHGLFIIYGLDPDMHEITFEEFISLIHPDDRTMVNSIINTAYSEKKFPDYYHRIQIHTGEIKTIHARGEIILDAAGNVIKMMGTGQDVTREKKIEEEMVQKSRKLELMNFELQKFAYITSHDLQEPLRKILTFSSRLKEETINSENDKIKLFTEKIINSTSRMQRLIDDVLKFSQLSNTNEFKTIDLKQILQNAINDMEVTIEKTNTEIDVTDLPEIEANDSQIGQLFQNLLSNAIKFQVTGISPVIKISSEIMQGSKLPENIHAKLTEMYAGSMINDINYLTYCLIRVSDNGIGFDQGYAERIFEVFQRLGAAGNYEGTGIGLAICKKIVQNHQGTITVISKPGNGTTFTITLPVKQ